MMLSSLGTSLYGDADFFMVNVFELMCVPYYRETLLFMLKRSNDWTFFLRVPRLFACSISSCDSDVIINIFDNFF